MMLPEQISRGRPSLPSLKPVELHSGGTVSFFDWFWLKEIVHTYSRRSPYTFDLPRTGVKLFLNMYLINIVVFVFTILRNISNAQKRSITCFMVTGKLSGYARNKSFSEIRKSGWKRFGSNLKLRLLNNPNLLGFPISSSPRWSLLEDLRFFASLV